MEESADKQMASDVVNELLEQGVKVRIKDRNGDGFALALLGPAVGRISVEALEKMPGVSCCANDEKSSRFYKEHFFDFEDPYGFFGWGF